MDVKTCRCCHAPGVHKDLNATYMWLNNKEIYSEMLEECFNIGILMLDNTSTAICEECIKTLRSSCNFKRQILHNERELLKSITDVQENDEKPRDVKLEPPPGGEDSNDYILPDAGQEPVGVKMESSPDDGDDWFLSDAEEVPMNSPKQIDDAKMYFNIGDLHQLVSAVIEHSTSMPFRWKSNTYMCFYCYNPFTSSQDLRHHTTTEHKNPKLKHILQNIKSTTKIKFDITDLTCKKCKHKLDDLTEFFDHLIAKHGMELKSELSIHITAFKLSDDGMFCLECGEKFLFFNTLVNHMNRFHPKTEMFPCEICGKSFTGKSDVINHVKAVHNTGKKTRCVQCDKSYSSEIALADHNRRMHRKERLKCPKCPEILQSPYFKKRHMALVHDVKRYQFKCDMCSKIFMLSSKLARHKAMTHFKEKNLTCEICGFKVFNRDGLKTHMVMHDDSKPFKCEFCEASFRRRKSLDFHVRTHTNDKRYVCKECEKAFVQLTSLKLHRKTHHPETAHLPWN